MDVNRTRFGTTTFGEPEVVETSHPGDPSRKVARTCAHGEWRPPERLAEFLPKGFSVPLDCETGPDGLRRIVPRCSFEELIDLGVAGGLAVIHGLNGFNKEVDHSYRAMQLIHQHVCGRDYLGTRGMKEHLTRQFQYARDLFVRRPGRPTDGERDVLPEDFGLTAQHEGHRVSVGQLMERGREAAREAGYRNPISKRAIPYGMYETAKLNPLGVRTEEVPGLVQRALFDTDPSDAAPSPEVIEIVTERLLEAIHARPAESSAGFYQWFVGPSNTLVKQIAQQKKSRGGELNRDDVRRALLYLGWHAYQYVGDCIHALMRTIKHSLPQPLNDDEKRIFEHMFERQPYYGDLPVALLAERLPFILPAVVAIMEEPQNEEHVHVLHRLLNNYASMAPVRRVADKKSKDRCQAGSREPPAKCDAADIAEVEDATDATGTEVRQPARRRVAFGECAFNEDLHSPVSADRNRFAEVADHIRRQRRIDCTAGCTRWEYLRKGDSKKWVTIHLRCECGQVTQEIRVSMDKFAEQAKVVLAWERRSSDSDGDDSDES